MKVKNWFRRQSIALRMLALTLASLLLILIIGGIRAIARVEQPQSAFVPSAPGSVLQAAPAPSPAAAPPLSATAPSASKTPTSEWDVPVTASPARSANPTAGSSPAASSPAAPSPTAPSAVAPSSQPVNSPIASTAGSPQEEVAFADSSNFGERYAADVYGNPVNNDWLIVLHETVGTADSAINTFQTPHPNEDDQVSYHTIIRRDGTVVYIVPPEKRAFGAGNSVFQGQNGVEAVRTDVNFPPSVNNFAYHISLETPPDGRNNNPTHSGYTQAQYQSLAWLIARTPVPDDRITTHQAIDQSGSRLDPRSFDAQTFFSYLRAYPRLQEAG